jgi:hypothetical protein
MCVCDRYNEGDMITQRSDDDSASDSEPANTTSSLHRFVFILFSGIQYIDWLPIVDVNKTKK